LNLKFKANSIEIFFLKLDIEVSKDKAKPGEEITIKASAKPESFVGLLGVDQSLLLLKKGNDIDMSTIFDEIKEHGGNANDILFISNAASFENDGEKTLARFGNVLNLCVSEIRDYSRDWVS
jgi:hypothetical protein